MNLKNRINKVESIVGKTSECQCSPQIKTLVAEMSRLCSEFEAPNLTDSETTLTNGVSSANHICMSEAASKRVLQDIEDIYGNDDNCSDCAAGRPIKTWADLTRTAALSK